MQFNSIAFLFAFFPLFLVVYFLVPKAWRQAVLALGSLVFYYQTGSNKILTMGMLVGLTLFTYLMGQWLGKKKSRDVLVFSLVILGGLMAFLKVFEGGKLFAAGMSFYMFQMAAFLIDVYREKLEPEKNLLHFSAQKIMFPKLMMGPLMDPVDLQHQVQNPDICYTSFHRGLQDLILGLGLKVLLADRVGGLWAQAGVIGYQSISTPFAWLALLSYAMRLYFDFWGYSLMAKGIGRMLGFYLPENFLDPYASGSVSAFWRRWHASLGAWFRNYIYIPLGGNRKGNLRTILNLAVVWLFTGLWHGVGGNYLLWAGILFFFILNERLWLRKYLEKTTVLRHVYTVLVILLSWIPFAIGNWDSMVMFTGRIFGFAGETLNPRDFIVWGKEYMWLLLSGVFFMTPMPRAIWNKIKNYALTDALLVVLLWVTVFFIATSAQDPFMYFDF